MNDVMPAAGAYKDRSTGLIVFGFLTVLMGALCGLFVPLMLLASTMAARQDPASVNQAATLPGVVCYGVLAVALIWLGVGSIRARRWARALLLIFSWSWLLVGFVSVLASAFILPSVFAGQPDLPAAARGVVIVSTMVFLGIFFILAPTLWVYFYGSRHVKATCEARDGVTRWTDASPLPVLAMCVWLVFSVLMMLLMPFMGLGVVPFFGVYLTGVPATLYCLILAGLWCYAAWLAYHLQPRGWWLILVTCVVLFASGAVTFARRDVLEMYELMGYPEAQLNEMRRFGLLTGKRMAWLMAPSCVLIVGYLLFVKRYFSRDATL